MATQKTQRVKVLRAFYAKGKVIGVGSIADLPAGIAAELRHAKKVEYVQADVKLKETQEITPPANASLPKDEAAGKGSKAA